MSETVNEQIATDASDDVEGHNARWPIVTPDADGVEGHGIHPGGVVDSNDDPAADDTEGHGFHGI